MLKNQVKTVTHSSTLPPSRDQKRVI